MKAFFTVEYDQVEFSPCFVLPWLALRINDKGTGINRATWSTGDEAQHQTGAFTITETDGASNP